MIQSIRSVLAIPAAYQLWFNVVGEPARAKVLVNEYVQLGVGVRSEREYVEIASQEFSKIRPGVRHDLLRIPYTHQILECVR